MKNNYDIENPDILKQNLDDCVSINQKALYLLELGNIEALKRNYDYAIKAFEEAQKLFLELKDFIKIATCLTELALLHYKKNNEKLIRSHTLLNDAKYIIENHRTEESQKIEAKIFHYHGIISYSERHFSEALKYYKSALFFLDKDTLEYAKVLDNLGLFYLRITNYSVASKYLDEALTVKQKLNNPLEYSNTLFLSGRYNASVENYELAIEQLLEAADITRKYEDYLTTARLYDEIAKTYVNIEDLPSAEKYCDKSLEFAEKAGSPLVNAFSSCTQANIFILNNDSEEALSILKEVVYPAFENANSKRGIALAKQIMAKVYNFTGFYDNAIENLHESIDLFNEIELPMEIVKCYYELSLVYKKLGESEMLVSCLLEALRIAKTNDLPALTQKIEDFLYEADINEWSSIIEKTAKKEKAFADNKNLLEALDIIGAMTGSNVSTKDPLLALLRLGRSIAAETDIDLLMEIIAEETKNALDADRCTVFLRDTEKNELWSKVALGMGSQKIRFPAHMGLAGHVVLTGESINIRDAYNDPRFNKEVDKQTGYKTKTILCMPIRNINHEIVGVFQVLNKLGDRVFTDKDEDLLIAIGSSAGIALENARLFKKQQLIFEEQKKSLDSFVNTLAASIDARDSITSGHSQRVTKYAIIIGEQMKFSSNDLDALKYAAILHDIGKIGIKDVVLCKEGKLTPEEYDHIQQHARITYDILSKMYFEERLKDVPLIAASHHEKYDGNGYFKGLKGEDIPLGGRVLAVSDVFDAITSKRHYRERMPIFNALKILMDGIGTHFDEKVVNSFFEIKTDKILNILLTAYDSILNEEERNFFSKYNVKELYEFFQKTETDRTEEEQDFIEKFEKYYAGVFYVRIVL